MELAAVMGAVSAAGLDDPQLLEAIRVEDVDDLLALIYPGRVVEVSEVARKYLETLIADEAARARLSRRHEDTGHSGGLGDARWVAVASRRRARTAEHGAAESAGHQASVPGTASAGLAWRPCKRVRRAAGLGEADRALLGKWSGRLATLLEKGDTPSWRQAQTAEDPATAVAGLVGQAQPSTVKKRVRD